MNNSKKIKWKQSYATFRGQSTKSKKYPIYKRNTKQVKLGMRRLFQKHYQKMILPDNLNKIWDPTGGKGGRGSLRQKKKYD